MSSVTSQPTKIYSLTYENSVKYYFPLMHRALRFSAHKNIKTKLKNPYKMDERMQFLRDETLLDEFDSEVGYHNMVDLLCTKRAM